MFKNLMFIVLVLFALFLDGLSFKASEEINGLFTGGRSRTQPLEASSSRSSVSE